jgi:predicted ABC-type ATPase
VLAGPNGSGKSTITRFLEFEGREHLIDPDAIARELNPTNLLAVAVAAGRLALHRTEDYLNQRVSFAIETTLAGGRGIDVMSMAKERGYEVHLAFVALDNPERNIDRIRDRVARGGHFVPDLDVRRRYSRSMANLPEAIRLADLARVYDNSKNARLVLIASAGKVTWQANPLPSWLHDGFRSASAS